MSADPEFSRKVREERRRRRRELAKQREQDPNAKYDASNKFTQQQIDAANKVAADHATNLHNDCDDTLDRILKTAHDTHDTGAKTLHQIHSQQEQLRKIHKDLHEIDQDQKDTESSLRTISSWGGQFKVCFSFFYAFCVFDSLFINLVSLCVCMFFFFRVGGKVTEKEKHTKV